MSKNINVPKLRFSEFSGMWEEKTLNYLIQSLDAGVSVNSTDKIASCGEKAILKTSCVSYGTFDINENKLVYEDIEIKRLKEPVQANTIIISRMNTPALVGANAFVENDCANVYLPDRLWSAKIKNTASAKWTSILTSSPKIRVLLSTRATGTSNTMKNITKGDVLTLPVLLPSKQEQEKIASFLTSIDTNIEQLTKKESLLQEYKKGVMQKIFNQEIRFKADDGSEFCEWEEKKIADFLKLTNNIKPDKICKDNILTVRLHQKGILKSKNTESLSLGANYYIRKKGQFIYGKQNLFNGAFGIIPSEMDGFLSSSDVPTLDFKTEVINPLFFNYYLGRNFFYNKLEIYASGTGSKRIHEKILLGLKVNFPTKNEQTKIANFLSSIDKKIENTKTQLEKTKEFKKALLQQMFV